MDQYKYEFSLNRFQKYFLMGKKYKPEPTLKDHFKDHWKFSMRVNNSNLSPCVKYILQSNISLIFSQDFMSPKRSHRKITVLS